EAVANRRPAQGEGQQAEQEDSTVEDANVALKHNFATDGIEKWLPQQEGDGDSGSNNDASSASNRESGGIQRVAAQVTKAQGQVQKGGQPGKASASAAEKDKNQNVKVNELDTGDGGGRSGQARPRMSDVLHG